MNIITYEELRKQSPKIAREIVRKFLLNNGGNVSKVAALLKTTRNTIYCSHKTVDKKKV